MNLDALKEIEAREFRGAAIHECAHAAVAQRFFGGVAKPYIWPNRSGDLGEKAWRGTCRIIVSPLRKHEIPDEIVEQVRPAPANWNVLVGLAGIVAQAMDVECRKAFWDGREIDDINADDIYELLTDGQVRLSETDKDLIGGDFSLEDVATAMDVLAEVWPALMEDAEDLMSDTGSHMPPAGYASR